MIYFIHILPVFEASKRFINVCSYFGRIYNDFEDLSNNSNFKPPESGFDIFQIKQLKIIFFVNGATEIKNEILEITLLIIKAKKKK